MGLLYIILTGLLVRADGWGPENAVVAKTWPAWKLRVAKFFNVWSCAALFGILCLTVTDTISAIACIGAFIIWRLPGFHGWQDYKEMYWRALWTSAIGFALVALATHTPFSGLLSVPFAAIYAVVYAGGYRYLPETILGFNKHVWIEHASGWAFGVCILILI